jgi:glyoxylase-like metal-dependent hydrolase (beta-lactamase superfamily II)
MEYERYEFTQPLYGGLNVFKIGTTLIDTGHVDPICRDDVADALDGPLADIDRVLHTHPHIDHIGGSQTIPELADLPHIVPVGEREILYDYNGYIRRARKEMTRLLESFPPELRSWDRYFPIQEYAEERIDIVREISDNDTVQCGGYELEVVSTPGHANPHIALWHEDSGTLFSGDLVDHNGRFQYGPLHADVGEYKASLRRVQSLEPDVLVPMHGDPMTDPETHLSQSLSNVAQTEERILDYVEANAPFYAREYVSEELDVTGARAPMLTLVIYEYLRHLDERDELEMAVTEDGIRAS